MVRGDIENMDTADIGEAGNTENLPYKILNKQKKDLQYMNTLNMNEEITLIVTNVEH